MTIHPEIKRKIALLQGYLHDFLPYTLVSTDELLKNSEKRAAMERHFL